jgi:hypothetical protein
MQADPIQTPHERLSNAERDVLYLLAGQGESSPIWSVPDLGREIESADDAEIAINGLLRAGLIYSTSDGFVFATRAGWRMVQMVGYVG